MPISSRNKSINSSEEEIRMRMSRLSLLLLCIGAFSGTASADEVIVKMQQVQRPGLFGLMNTVFTHELVLFTPVDLNGQTFRVFTKEEVDSRLVNDEKTINDLNDLVRLLRQNVKDLTDLNDALAKRLDALEKRMTLSQ